MFHTTRNGALVGLPPVADSSDNSGPNAAPADAACTSGDPAHTSRGKSTMPPHIWPHRARKEGMRVLLRAVAEHCRRRGYWPTRGELARFLHTKHYAVQWYTDELFAVGMLERCGRRWYNECRPTDAGWCALGIEPIVPWTRRSKPSEKQKIVARIYRDLIKEQLRVADPSGVVLVRPRSEQPRPEGVS